MTVEQAILAANRMRPNNPFDVEDKWRWLAECDALIRSQVVDRSCTGDYENRGADRAAEFDDLEETTELLAPAPYDALYPHYLCGQMDAALGEADRAANELAQYNSLLSGFAAWMRRTYMPAKKPWIVW